ncbi:MAG: alpha-amylase, partial [Thermodesulfobacteriota bacterium]
PMFAHGQIEGFQEKYGMEYRYAKWDEKPDRELIQRHEREIFPLIKRRHLFSDVKNFLLYDFFTPEGYVNENVFAYSNRSGEERALVIYHNKYDFARGWIRTSVSYSVKRREGEEPQLIQKNLGEGLGLHNDSTYFCIFRDHVSGLEYIRNSKELYEKGLYVELGAYKVHVFLDFREVQDNQWNHYAQMALSLNGRGTPNMEEVSKEIQLQPLQKSFKELIHADLIRRLMEARITQPQGQLDQILTEEIEKKMVNFLREVKQFSGGREEEVRMAREVRQKLEAILYLPIITSRYSRLQPKGVKAVAEYLHRGLDDSLSTWATLFGWLFIHSIGKIVEQRDFIERSDRWIEEWRLGKIIGDVFRELGIEERSTLRSLILIKLLTRHQRWFEEETAFEVLEKLFKESEARQFLGVNQYEGIWWFNKESFEELLWWLMLISAIEIGFDPLRPINEMMKKLERCWSLIEKIQEAEAHSEYQVKKLLSIRP